MRSGGLLALGLGASGCASRYDAGQALIAGGTVVAVVASELATSGDPTCGGMPCTTWGGSTSKYQKEAAIGVGAGVALAAVGSVLRDSDTPPEHRKKAPPRPDPE